MIPTCVILIAFDISLLIAGVLMSVYASVSDVALYITIAFTVVFVGATLYFVIAVPHWNHQNCE
jgi:hypothetical protein